MKDYAIVPAQPGYSVVGWHEKEDGTFLELTFTPIIAWQFAAPDFYAEPVIPPGAFWDEDQGIGYSDGRIVINEQVFLVGTPPEDVFAALKIAERNRKSVEEIQAKFKTVR